VSRPKLLDLFCGAGGAGMGYHWAGFDVTGVDVKPQPRYPFAFVQADALDYLATTAPHWDAIHASPPCQRYSLATPHARRESHPDLLAPTREALEASGGVPWVIENVPGAPMRPDIRCCGCWLGLELRRERLFETSWRAFELRPPCKHEYPVVSVVGHGTPSWVRKQLGYNPTIAQYRAAMGIDWMNRNELSEAIPPAYTAYVGRQLMRALDLCGVA
jgi:DNA (cytosine-5)-methyltransferase 1